MVKKFHGKGMVVIDESAAATAKLLQISLKMKKTTMKDIMEFRNSIEIKMTELAAKRATDEQIQIISGHLEKMKNEEYKLDTFAEFNSVFSLMMETMRPMLYNHIIYTLNPTFNPEHSNHYHEKILQTIRDRNPEEAVEAMRLHLTGTERIIEELEGVNVTI